MIDLKTTQNVAILARLKMNENEANEYTQQLSKVLTHFEQISKINTTGVEPLVSPSDIEVYLRPDVVKQEFTTEEMVANAPDKAGNLFKVPPVV